MKTYNFIVTCFGDRRKQFIDLMNNLRNYCCKKIHVVLVTDDAKIYSEQCRVLENKYFVITRKEVSISYCQDHERYGVRNSNLWKVHYALHWEDYFGEPVPTSLCLLDDDMKIVSDEFFSGFDLAERFGCCLPANPRVHVKFNAITEDTTIQDRLDVFKYKVLPAVNMSPMFLGLYDNYRLHNGTRTREFLEAYRQILKSDVCRGTLALSKAMIKTSFTPLILPEQWCVGRQNAKHFKNYHFHYREKRYDVKPICLHYGQPEVREVFK